MRHASRFTRLPLPAADVFTFLSDIANLPRWQSGVIRAEKLTPGALAIGTVARVERRVMGQEVAVDLEVVELEPGHRLVLRTETSGIRVDASIQVDPVAPADSRVTFGMAMDAVNLFMKAAEPMIAQAAEKDIEESLRGLRRAVLPAVDHAESSA